MYRILSLIVCTGLCFGNGWAQLPSPPPDSLLDNANAIINDYQEMIRITDPEHFTSTIDSWVTVLNEDGDRHAFMVLSYDKFSKATIEDASIYDQEGRGIKNLKQRDFTDQSLNSDNALYQDDRVLYYDWTPTGYPYTVHFRYSIQYRGTLNYTNWSPRNEFRLSLQKASLEVRVPQDLTIRIKAFRIEPGEPKADHGNTTYFWEVTNLPALAEEYSSSGAASISPVILIGPQQFEFDGSKGSMESWQSFGNWVNTLWQGRNDISSGLKSEIAGWKSETEDQVELARKIYQYVQGHTRYVSIQLGIGGYQPFPASYVEKYGYGDCKALVNFTASMMQEAGIEARVVVIGAGKGIHSIEYSDYPSTSQANHVILCLPDLQDTVWLECTSQDAPFGYLGNFTAARNGLLIEPGLGGIIVQTPDVQDLKSHFSRHTVLKIDDQGNASGTMRARYDGLAFDNAILRMLSVEEQRQRLLSLYNYLPRLHLEDIQSVEEADAPHAVEHFSYQADGYAKKVGNKWLIDPQPFSGIQVYPPKLPQRLTDIRINGIISAVDTIDVLLPAQYSLTTLPASIHLEMSFGHYSLEVNPLENGYQITREFYLDGGTFPAAAYDEFQQFLEQVSKADKKKWLLTPDKT